MALQERSTDKLVLLRIPVPCHISEIDRGTGETMKFALAAQLELPQLRQLASVCSHVMHVTTGDRAAANDCCEDGFYFEQPSVPRLRLSCTPHCISTAQGRTYGCVADDMSGMIAASLVQNQNSYILRQEIEKVLLASVCLTTVMPAEDSECMWRRTALFDAVFPGRAAAVVKRRAQLELLLHGDFSHDLVLWVVPCVASADVTLWAKKVAWLLYPAKIPPIPRQRWANSLHSQGEYTLLANVHNILQRAGPRWLQRVSGEVPPVLRPLDPILDAPARCRDSAWEFDSDGEAPPPEAEAMVEVDPFMLQAATGLAAQTDAVKEFNAKQKGRARKFVCGEPQHRLIVSVVCLMVAVTFLHSAEAVCGHMWETRSWARCTSENVDFPSRMVTAARGHVYDRAGEVAFGALTESRRWDALQPAGKTFGTAGLAFVMLSTFTCAIDQILLRFWRQWPYKIFLLLRPECFDRVAKELLAAPRCMLDEWSFRFRQMFPTLARVASVACRTLLITLSVVCRWDITRIECRNALLRRLARAYDTWTPDVGRVSARFLLRGQRTLERPRAGCRRRAMPRRSSARTAKFRTACCCVAFFFRINEVQSSE